MSLVPPDMKYALRPTFLLIVSIMAFGQIARAQEFPCDGSLYMALNASASRTVIYRVALSNSGVILDSLTECHLALNAAGYDAESGRMIALQRGTNNIVSVGRDGSYFTVGQDTTVTKWKARSADCTSNGLLIVQERNSLTLRVYQIEPEFEHLSSFQMHWAPESGRSGIVEVFFDDLAIDPDNPRFMYAYQRNYFSDNNPGAPEETRGYLMRINIDFDSPDVGEVALVGRIDSNIVNQMGSLFFDPGGRLFGYGSQEFPKQVQRYLIAMDKHTAEAWRIGIGQAVSGSDGCACPYGVELYHEIKSIEAGCSRQTVYSTVTIINNSDDKISNITVSVDSTDGRAFNALQNPPTSASVVNFNEDSSRLSITGIEVDPKSRIEFPLSFHVPNVTGEFQSQIELTDVPERFGSIHLSDDPLTWDFNDPSAFSTTYYDQGEETVVFEEICEGDVLALQGNEYSASGIYPIVLANAAENGCDSIIYLHLDVEPKPELRVEHMICHGESITVGDQVFAESGTYEIVMPSADNSCDTSAFVVLDIIAPLEILTPTTIDIVKQSRPRVNIRANRPISLISWEMAPGLSCTDCINPEISVDKPSIFAYTIFDDLGCSATSELHVNLIDDTSDVFIPNAFSPNGDGVNDELTISGKGITQLVSMRIIDRYGGVLFEASGASASPANISWDGEYKGQYVGPGVYMCAINYVSSSGLTRRIVQDVSVIR